MTVGRGTDQPTNQPTNQPTKVFEFVKLLLRLQRSQKEGESGEREQTNQKIKMEVNNLEVEADLSTMAALLWTEGLWMSKWSREQLKARWRQVF